MEGTRLKIIIGLIVMLLGGCDGTSVAPTKIDETARTTFVAHPATGPVVFIGDSITARWADLTTLVPDSVNVGVSGQTSVQMLARFQDDVLALHPSVVVIDAGINDISHLSDPSIDSVTEMASEASAAGAKVVICTLLPSSHWIANSPVATEEQGQYDIRLFNGQLLLMADAYGYIVVDYYHSFIETNWAPNPSLFVDYIHPNDAGYALMWSILKPVLDAL